MRWCVMQSLKHKKWVLAVMKEDFTGYRVTDIMSEQVEQLIRCADYLNGSSNGSGIRQDLLEELERVRKKMEQDKA